MILEPDGLGIIPGTTPTVDDHVLESCQPAETPASTAAPDRFEQLNYAVDALKAGAQHVGLSRRHASGWLGVGDISDRLLQGRRAGADGFFLNASNYVQTERPAEVRDVDLEVHRVLTQRSAAHPTSARNQY